MLSRKLKLLKLQIRAKRRVKLLRKRDLTARNKAIRLYQTRWFKNTNSAHLPSTLGKKLGADRTCNSAFKELNLDREFNYYLYNQRRVFGATTVASTKLAPRRLTISSGRGKLTATAVKTLKRAARLVVSRYYRRLGYGFQLPASTNLSTTKREITTRRGRRRLRRCRRAGVKAVSNQLLVQKASVGLHNEILPAPRLSKNLATTVLFDTQFDAATAEKRAGQSLLTVASATSPLGAPKLPTVSKGASRRRENRKWAYETTKCRFIAFARRLYRCKRAPSRSRRQMRRSAAIRRLSKKYTSARLALRRRFFMRRLRSAQQTSRDVLNLPKLSKKEIYAAQRSVFIRTKRSLQKSRPLLLPKTVGLLLQAVRRKNLPLKKRALGRAQLRVLRPVRFPPTAKHLLCSNSKSRFALLKNKVQSSLRTYQVARDTQFRFRLKVSTRRQRRAAVKTARLLRGVSKGQQKRLRLGRICKQAKLVGYPALYFAPQKGAAVIWKRRPSPALRRRLRKQLDAITTAFTVLTQLRTKYARRLPAPFPPVKGAAHRAALWALFSAANSHRVYTAASTETRQSAELLVRNVRGALRGRDTLSTREITLAFIFLLGVCSAPSKRRLHSQFKRWLNAPQKADQAVHGNQISPLSKVLRAIRRSQQARAARKDLKRARKLARLLQGSTAAARSLSSLLQQLATRFKSADSSRRKLHNATVFNTPRPALRVCQETVSAPFAGQKLLTPEVAPYAHELPKLTPSTIICQLPYLTRHVAAAPTLATPSPAALGGSTTTAHEDITIFPSAQRKKRLLRRRRHRNATRFTRFIPRYVKTRLAQAYTTARNKLAAPGTKAQVTRYLRAIYPKGNRIFVVRYKKGHRIATQRLVKQQRWSRATLLRLSRYRPAWRHTLRGRQINTSTGRTIVLTPVAQGNAGWRARKARIKGRSALRMTTERFKNFIHQVNSLLPSVVTAQSGTTCAVLGVLTSTAQELTPSTPAALAVTAFHKTQRLLATIRLRRAAHTRAKFNVALRKTASRKYVRIRGRFRLLKGRKKARKRKPRWTRVLSTTAPQQLNFAPVQSPDLSAAGNESSFATTSEAPQLRKQLWGGLGRYCVGQELSKKLPFPSGATTAPFVDRPALAKKMRRLSLFKKLLRGNKFTKLARLGELNLLGDHAYLAGLDKLFALGTFTGELKQQLLLKLATDIKQCASLFAQDLSPCTHTQGVTTSEASRTLFVYKKPPLILGRDPAFFLSDTKPVRASKHKLLRKRVLLTTLSSVKTKKAGSVQAATRRPHLILSRSAKTALLTRAKRLQRYRRALLTQRAIGRVKSKERKATTQVAGGKLEQTDQLTALWNKMRPPRKRSAKRAWQRQPAKSARSRKHLKAPARKAARFITLRKLPTAYKGSIHTVATPQLWSSRLGRWTRAAAKNKTSSFRAGTLAKSFSVARPWALKTLYSWGVAKEYARFTAGAGADISVFKTPKRLLPHLRSPGFVGPLTAFRLAAARLIYANRLPSVLHFPNSTTGRKAWHLRAPAREDIQLQAEVRLQALLRSRQRGRHPQGRPQLAVESKTIAPAPVEHPFGSYHIRKLDITVYDETVRSNLRHYSDLPPEDRAGFKGYDLVKRAYKAALSSQEKNPNLPQPRFDEQKARIAPLLERLAGVPIGEKVLEWKQLPKNQTTPALPAVPASVVSAHTQVTGAVAIIPGELTEKEITSICDETTKKNLKKFRATKPADRYNESVYVCVKKAVLHSWTKVEEAATPEASLYYNDLRLAAKAYSFYKVTLDLTSKAATSAKVAASFAKLPK